MGLLLDDIKLILKEKKRNPNISKAAKYEGRLRFHSEAEMSMHDVGGPLTDFTDWVRTLIPADKFFTFMNLFRFPTPNIQLVDTIYTELQRVLDAKNPAYIYKFSSPEYSADYMEYRKKIKEVDFWRIKAWRKMISSINSMIVVDLPEEQTTDRPEPYFYFKDISKIHDYKSDHEGNIEWVMFKEEEDVIIVIDNEAYSKFKLNEHDEIEAQLSRSEHGLGYCPVRFFWTTPLTSRCNDIKMAPISKQLSNLDWLLFFTLSKRHLDLYAAYPIYSAYETDCDYEDEDSGDHCDGGYIRGDDDKYKVGADGRLMQCPVCSSKRLSGAGSFVEVPVPSGDDVDLRNPVSITTIDRQSLDYNVEEVKRLAADIFAGAVGMNGDVQIEQSINEAQVEANLESRLSTLNSLKPNFEQARKWVDDTVCKLRYGDVFEGSSISLGTEFYMYTVQDLREQKQTAKTTGANASELRAMDDKILDTEYRNNEQIHSRMLILRELEPYQNHTVNELINMVHSVEGIIDPILLKIKINFNNFIDRFERENMDIMSFGSNTDFKTKINNILLKLVEYAKETN